MEGGGFLRKKSREKIFFHKRICFFLFSKNIFYFNLKMMFFLEQNVFLTTERGFWTREWGLLEKKVLFSELWQIHSARLTLLTGRYWFKMWMVWQERLYEMWKMELERSPPAAMAHNS